MHTHMPDILMVARGILAACGVTRTHTNEMMTSLLCMCIGAEYICVNVNGGLVLDNANAPKPGGGAIILYA